MFEQLSKLAETAFSIATSPLFLVVYMKQFNPPVIAPFRDLGQAFHDAPLQTLEVGMYNVSHPNSSTVTTVEVKRKKKGSDTYGVVRAEDKKGGLLKGKQFRYHDGLMVEIPFSGQSQSVVLNSAGGELFAVAEQVGVQPISAVAVSSMIWYKPEGEPALEDQ